MKIRIETDDKIEEPEIVIRSRILDNEVAKVQAAIIDALSKTQKMALTHGGKEYYLPPETVLFFEAAGGKTFAHTPKNAYEVRQKLYELEETLPRSFVRAGKSVVIGTKYVYAITRNLTGPSA
ncbi:LytTR family transcriptional regulator, partial [Candidatus Saccharibacteria bacterium]|nr:LytTR family transcriptional regulator [Candidatus Saccharibacteria bacterium]